MIDEIWTGDCLQLMKQIPSGSVDCILCDLPYGTTACSWDVVIPFEPLWEQYKRIIKRNGAIVLTGSEPFSSYLRLSNIGWYKYDWIWLKSKATGFLNAKKQPLKKTEDVCVFYGSQCTYNPQMKKVKQRFVSRSGEYQGYGKHVALSSSNGGVQYPFNTIEIPSVFGGQHPTEKPVDLFAYLIRTYTNEGELVLDNCCGSGTCAVAAIQTGRHYLCMEQSEEYCKIAERRVLSARQQLTLSL